MGVIDMLREPKRITENELGAMASDRVVISRMAFLALGGYSPAFGAGGEDNDMAKRLLRYGHGLDVVRDPVLAMHHTHGLGPVRCLIQRLDWSRISERPHQYQPLMRKVLGLPQF
jgi:hypothetical protein